MTTTKKPPVPYAERLARESVKFGLRVGGSFLRHTPGLLKIGLLGLPLVLMGLGGQDGDHDSEQEGGISDQGRSEAGVVYDEYGDVQSPLTAKELDDYNRFLI